MGGIKQFQTYKNILELIEINETIKYSCQITLLNIQKFLLKQGRPAGYSTGMSYLDADCIHGGKPEIGAIELERMAENIELMEEIIEKQIEILQEFYNAKNQIDTRLCRLAGTDYEVAYLRLVEGLPLKNIAENLHISYGHAKNISSRI